MAVNGKQKERVSPLERVAYHEAGHAVASYYAGDSPRGIKRVTIVPNADYLGQVSHWTLPRFDPESDLSGTARIRLIDEIIILLAGSVAEKKFTGRANHQGASYDYRCAVDLAMYMQGSDKTNSAMLRWLRLLAGDIVDIHWSSVKAVARALLVEKILTGKQVGNVIVEQNKRYLEAYQQKREAKKGGANG